MILKKLAQAIIACSLLGSTFLLADSSNSSSSMFGYQQSDKNIETIILTKSLAIDEHDGKHRKRHARNKDDNESAQRKKNQKHDGHKHRHKKAKGGDDALDKKDRKGKHRKHHEQNTQHENNAHDKKERKKHRQKHDNKNSKDGENT